MHHDPLDLEAPHRRDKIGDAFRTFVIMIFVVLPLGIAVIATLQWIFS